MSVAQSTRRDVLRRLLATTSFLLVAGRVVADKSRVSLSRLGKETIRHAGLYLFEEQTPESIKADILDGAVIGNTWEQSNIANAITEAWIHIKDDPAVLEFVEKHQAGDTSQFEKFTTNKGHTAQSAVDSIDKMFDDARKAVEEAANGQIRRAYDGVYDRGIQAYILLVADDPSYKDSVLNALDGLKANWHAGFEIFKEQSLIPFLEGAPTGAAPAEQKALPGFDKN